MKKLILPFLLGGIIFGYVGIRATSYLATDISYTANNENWNVSNVNDALDSLYNLTNDSNLILEDTTGYSDGTHVYTHNVEEDGSYLIGFATSKARLHCSDATTNISVSGYETLDILYDQTSDTGWSYDGSSQLHLYLAKITMKSGNTITINTSIGNGYSLGKLVLLRM